MGLRQARNMGRHKAAAQLYLNAAGDHLTPHPGTPPPLGFSACLNPAATSKSHRQNAGGALVPRSGPTGTREPQAVAERWLLSALM